MNDYLEAPKTVFSFLVDLPQFLCIWKNYLCQAKRCSIKQVSVRNACWSLFIVERVSLLNNRHYHRYFNMDIPKFENYSSGEHLWMNTSKIQTLLYRRTLLAQSQGWKPQNNVWHLFKIYNEDTRTTSMKSFWCL